MSTRDQIIKWVAGIGDEAMADEIISRDERIMELTNAFEDAENRIIELREVSDKLEKAITPP